jgi:hypothetical protein
MLDVDVEAGLLREQRVPQERRRLESAVHTLARGKNILQGRWVHVQGGLLVGSAELRR